ncbi:hypothetical protein CLG94_11700 [Candidatus Methylomirabilis limnetica]|jgi:uncharacterized membrane protein YeaQ/YmgE (transglycosylase-associated protein family)|uniref:Uncharacterized protein n=1 Tax=Candidatus Methylomirabilis limnetica TaxID=2033718 RepID=A0A2T4TVA2_9BACT|nr:hypothetical protein [Candidatus Methylomirabilis limnetica]PTL35041.1 hypothetical protein CLG94_11700 [Candidatus Methylomirabilis limnetica]
MPTVADISMTPIGVVAFQAIVIGLVIGLITSRIKKTLGVGASLLCGAIGSMAGSIGVFLMSIGKIENETAVVMASLGAILGSLIVLFVTLLLKNRSLVNPS